MTTLAQRLEQLSKPGWLYNPTDDQGVCCHACAHRCLIQPGRRGICQMRFNAGGTLMVPWGYAAALNVDPIEKKPYMHFLPGHEALTFGMLGCNFHCDFCQNWVSSQALRDPAAENSTRFIEEITPEDMVRHARCGGADIIASSYNEPLITSEWALEIFRLAKADGLRCVYVSNGFATLEVLQALQPLLDGFKVDLKCFTDEKYRSLGGRLQPVLESIHLAHELGMWVEVVTLIVPGFNDRPEELRPMAEFLAGVSFDIPWHVTAFYPTYKHTEGSRTATETLLGAARIGQDAGLRYVYAGNLPGRVGSLEDTHCPTCHRPLIERSGYFIRANRLGADGKCPYCGTAIAGVWQ